ncbi:MAG: YceI family protein [Elusimicrobia bacterium]|nr:YceI family protein [Elusimicrobiota bacterium]
MTYVFAALLLTQTCWAAGPAPGKADPAKDLLSFTIDPDHSSVGFRIRHLVGRVPGKFTRFSGSFSGKRSDPGTWKTEAKIDAGSIDTGVVKRDEHLRSADFLDTAKCPEISFVSKKAFGAAKTTAKLKGELTLHCVTKPVVLDLESDGTAKDPRGDLRAGVTARAKINRKDYGIVFNQVLDTGGTLLGDEVEITIDVEGVAR